MSILGGIVKIAGAIVLTAAGTKAGKEGYKNIKDKLSSNNK